MDRLAHVYAAENVREAGGDRLTAREIAETRCYMAMHEPREWTRYEMALVEVFEPDYPQDVTVGSGYADMAPFRHKASRIPGPPTEIELMDAKRSAAKRAQLAALDDAQPSSRFTPGARLTPVYQARPEGDPSDPAENLPAVASTESLIEGAGEFDDEHSE